MLLFQGWSAEYCGSIASLNLLRCLPDELYCTTGTYSAYTLFNACCNKSLMTVCSGQSTLTTASISGTVSLLLFLNYVLIKTIVYHVY